MRNPNGYGGVVKLPGKRRRPYWARVTDRWEELPNGSKKQVYKTIGYFKDRTEAFLALATYNENPSAIDAINTTFGDVYETWSKRKYDKDIKGHISDSQIKAYKLAYSLCKPLIGMRMSEIKKDHLQKIIDGSNKNQPTLRKVKTLFSQLYEYAMANDIIDKDYSQYVELPKLEKKILRSPFTEKEIQALWDNVDRHEWIDTVLIQIYTGMRIGELLSIQRDKVFINEKYMRGGSKTDAGKDRVIPMHNKIIPLIERRLDCDKNLLIVNKTDGGALSYDTYRDVYWRNMMEQLGMTHLPHDCRHTFASLADTYKMNKVCIKRIMGHASSDITDKVYTHKEIEELINEVNKLP